MSTDYKESIVEGVESCWRRIGSFSGYNPYGGQPKLILNEEDVTITPSGKVIVEDGVGRLEVLFNSDNPRHAQIYKLLDEEYQELRAIRDNPVEQPIEPPLPEQLIEPPLPEQLIEPQLPEQSIEPQLPEDIVTPEP